MKHQCSSATHQTRPTWHPAFHALHMHWYAQACALPMCTVDLATVTYCLPLPVLGDMRKSSGWLFEGTGPLQCVTNTFVCAVPDVLAPSLSNHC